MPTKATVLASNAEPEPAAAARSCFPKRAMSLEAGATPSILRDHRSSNKHARLVRCPAARFRRRRTRTSTVREGPGYDPTLFAQRRRDPTAQLAINLPL